MQLALHHWPLPHSPWWPWPQVLETLQGGPAQPPSPLWSTSQPERTFTMATVSDPGTCQLPRVFFPTVHPARLWPGSPEGTW